MQNILNEHDVLTRKFEREINNNSRSLTTILYQIFQNNIRKNKYNVPHLDLVFLCSKLDGNILNEEKKLIVSYLNSLNASREFSKEEIDFFQVCFTIIEFRLIEPHSKKIDERLMNKICYLFKNSKNVNQLCEIPYIISGNLGTFSEFRFNDSFFSSLRDEASYLAAISKFERFPQSSYNKKLKIDDLIDSIQIYHEKLKSSKNDNSGFKSSELEIINKFEKISQKIREKQNKNYVVYEGGEYANQRNAPQIDEFTPKYIYAIKMEPQFQKNPSIIESKNSAKIIPHGYEIHVCYLNFEQGQEVRWDIKDSEDNVNCTLNIFTTNPSVYKPLKIKIFNRRIETNPHYGFSINFSNFIFSLKFHYKKVF